MVRYQGKIVFMEAIMFFSLAKKSNFILMGGVSDRSNFGPKFGIENLGGAIGGIMGGAESLGGSTTVPNGGHEV